MKFWSRLQWGLQSEIGVILIGLIIALLISLVLYGIVVKKQKRRDILQFFFPAYYSEVDSLLKAKGYLFQSDSSALLVRNSLFCREWKVQSKRRDHGWAYCYSPPPSLSQEKNRERFHQFQEAMHGSVSPLFPACSWLSVDHVWFVLTEQVMDKNGHLHLSLYDHLLDKEITQTGAENILIWIAKGLAEIHALSTDQGEQLYHGWIHPAAILLTFNEYKEVNQTLLAYLGFAYALGGEELYSLFSQVRNQSHWISKWESKTSQQRLQHSLDFLAPEQKNRNSLHQVGAPSDLFSFAAVSIFLFTRQIPTELSSALTEGGNGEIPWEQIPLSWHSFLRSCLQKDPQERPKSIHHLLDTLFDPELQSIHISDSSFFSAEEFSSCEISERKEGEYADQKNVEGDLLLEEIAKSFHVGDSGEERKIESTEERAQIEEYVNKGDRALHQRQWQRAYIHFKKAESLFSIHSSKDCSEIELKLAIVCYRVGREEESKRYYEKLRDHSPQLCRQFHQKIAFQI